MEMMMFPGFEHRQRLIDEIARGIWYMQPLREQINRVLFFYRGEEGEAFDVDSLLSNFSEHLPPAYDPTISEWAPQWLGKFQMIWDPDKTKQKSWSQRTGGIVLWDQFMGEVETDLERMLAFTGGEFIHASPEHVMGESVNRSLLTHFLMKRLRDTGYDERSRHCLESLKAEVNGREVCVYGSAPSIGEFLQSSFELGDAVHVVTNTVIKNKELIEQVKPRVVVCADPVFHAGPSRYAEAFRQELNNFLDAYEPYLVTNVDLIPNFECLVAPHHHERFIGVELGRRPKSNLNLLSDLTIKSTENILTLIALPLAFTLSSRVSILGCDGRSFAEQEFVWAHDKRSNLDDLLDQARHVHPAFFSRDANEYYLSHCQTVATLLDQAEAEGNTVRTLTPSFVPALAKRFAVIG